MSHNGLPTQTGQSGSRTDLAQPQAAPLPAVSLSAESASLPAGRYNDLQSAARFPIKLPISFKSKSGESRTETQNISANGVLFRVDADMPVGAALDFTISLPASVVGTEADVQIDCRGRVVRSVAESGRRDVGVVIDEYHFERR